MNITLLRLRPLLKVLHGIHDELRRANDIREFELAHKDDIHFRPARADKSGDEPEALYVDEEADYYRELAEELGKVAKHQEPPESD